MEGDAQLGRVAGRVQSRLAARWAVGGGRWAPRRGLGEVHRVWHLVVQFAVCEVSGAAARGVARPFRGK
jgi:hypothetical protein